MSEDSTPKAPEEKKQDAEPGTTEMTEEEKKNEADMNEILRKQRVLNTLQRSSKLLGFRMMTDHFDRDTKKE